VQDPQGAVVTGAKVTGIPEESCYRREAVSSLGGVRVRKSANASGSGHFTENVHFYAVSVGFDSDA
jgi:hypothetical protein